MGETIPCATVIRMGRQTPVHDPRVNFRRDTMTRNDADFLVRTPFFSGFVVSLANCQIIRQTLVIFRVFRKIERGPNRPEKEIARVDTCLLYTSDAADE